MAFSKDILVVAQVDETNKAAITSLSFEMLGRARELADQLGGSVTAVLFGASFEAEAETLVAYGADKVTLVEGDLLVPYRADAWLPDLVAMASELSPALILIGQGSIGGDLAPRLAFQLESSVATGCEDVSLEGDKVLLTRACYGGKAREVVSFNCATSVVTIKPKSLSAMPCDRARSGEIVTLPASVAAEAIRTTVTNRESEELVGQQLESAEVIVAGGGGLGGPEGFQAVAALADVLGGTVGASRVACDMGWCPSHMQVGLSGKTVAPQLYVAVGISGASHHMAGCANSNAIVAINADPDAPIFNYAHFGVIGEFEELIPALTEEITKLKG